MFTTRYFLKQIRLGNHKESICTCRFLCYFFTNFNRGALTKFSALQNTLSKTTSRSGSLFLESSLVSALNVFFTIGFSSWARVEDYISKTVPATIFVEVHTRLNRFGDNHLSRGEFWSSECRPLEDRREKDRSFIAPRPRIRSDLFILIQIFILCSYRENIKFNFNYFSYVKM